MSCHKHPHAWQFRFADTVKPEVTSPLSDAEIDAIWWSLKPVGNEMPSHHDIGRAIANAAHARCLQDEAKAREELIARYDSLQSQYAELSVALDSVPHEPVRTCESEWKLYYARAEIEPKQSLYFAFEAGWCKALEVKPTPAPKPKTVTSTLTYDEIVECLRVSPYEGEINKAARVANAAAKAQDALTRKAVIREVAAMAFDTSLLAYSGRGFSAAAMRQFAGACVAEFQQKLLAGIGETK